LTTFAERAFAFYRSLEAPKVPRGVSVMNPYADPPVRGYVRAFLDRYFADTGERLLVLGINPGRFGAGITGITFTDPVVLADVCGIANALPRRRELSSIFVYELIDRLGGPHTFYRRFFLSAVSPLGLVSKGKNLNYYDAPNVARAMTPFIARTMEQQLALGARRDHAIVLGRGENARFLERLNAQRGWFGAIHALDHPRAIMQYKRKQVADYVARYGELFERLTAADPRARNQPAALRAADSGRSSPTSPGARTA
jgi:hypothetical protein